MDSIEQTTYYPIYCSIDLCQHTNLPYSFPLLAFHKQEDSVRNKFTKLFSSIVHGTIVFRFLKARLTVHKDNFRNEMEKEYHLNCIHDYVLGKCNTATFQFYWLRKTSGALTCTRKT